MYCYVFKHIGQFFAQADLHDLSRGFQSEGRNWTFALLFLFLLATFAAILFWAWHVGRKSGQGPKLDNPDQLFLELARAHGLSREERAVLRRLAMELELDSPGRIFVRPDLFQEGYALLLQSENPPDEELIEHLQQRIFAPPLALEVDQEES